MAGIVLIQKNDSREFLNSKMFGHKSFWDFSYNWILRKGNEGLENLNGLGLGGG